MARSENTKLSKIIIIFSLLKNCLVIYREFLRVIMFRTFVLMGKWALPKCMVLVPVVARVF
jgi:hypothetical protein